jgi:hypothetical protein
MADKKPIQFGAWYSKNEKAIRWTTMLAAWAAGIALIATGVGAAGGLALIAGGTAYGGGTPLVRQWRAKTMAKKAAAIVEASEEAYYRVR